MSWKRTASKLTCPGAICLAWLTLGPAPGLAQAYYPRQATVSDKLPDSEARDFFTRDTLQSVRGYYEQRKKPEDHFQDAMMGRERGFALSMEREIQGSVRQLPAVAFFEIDPSLPDAEVPIPLQRLKALVGKSKHTQAEYDAVAREFADLKRAYYRFIETLAGYESEDKVIVNNYHDRLTAEPSIEEKAAPDQKRDDWGLWVQCLRELKAAAYWTHIQYSIYYRYF